MFHRNKEKEIDVSSLNQLLIYGKRIMSIGFIMAIVALILLGTYVIKEWKILEILKDLFVIISPIFIGLLIAWFFEPTVSMLEEKKVPRLIGCILVYIGFLGILFLIAYLFIPSLISQIKDFVKVAPSVFENVTDFIIEFIRKIDAGKLINTNTLKSDIMNYIATLGSENSNEIPKYLISIGQSIFKGGVNFILGLMIGFYLLFDFNKINIRIQKILPNNWKKGYEELTTQINTSLRSYIQGVIIVMLLVFITQTIGLTIAGITSPILFALFCAITDIIPYFGPYIGAIPAIIVGFTISPVTGICVIISILIVQLLENNFYQPLIMGHTMKLHPVTIMLGLLIFQHFFGIIGMVIATPAIACLKVLLKFANKNLHIVERLTGNKEEIELIE